MTPKKADDSKRQGLEEVVGSTYCSWELRCVREIKKRPKVHSQSELVPRTCEMFNEKWEHYRLEEYAALSGELAFILKTIFKKKILFDVPPLEKKEKKKNVFALTFSATIRPGSGSAFWIKLMDPDRL